VIFSEENLIAFEALVYFRIDVALEMIFSVSFRIEALATYMTGIGLVSTVNTEVNVEVAFFRKVLVT